MSRTLDLAPPELLRTQCAASVRAVEELNGDFAVADTTLERRGDGCGGRGTGGLGATLAGDWESWKVKVIEVVFEASGRGVSVLRVIAHVCCYGMCREDELPAGFISLLLDTKMAHRGG